MYGFTPNSKSQANETKVNGLIYKFEERKKLLKG